jgi:hypothetical protein
MPAASSISAEGATDDRGKIAAVEAQVLHFAIIELIELADLGGRHVACRQSGRKATELRPDSSQ